MRLDEGQISALLEREIQQAQGYDSDVLAAKRESALNYYQGIMAPPAEGRSSIVSKDVADGIHGLLAQMQPVIKSTMLAFSPESDEDEQQAQTESDFTIQAMERAGGWRVVFESVHDALLMGNGWIKVDTDEDTKVTTEQYPPDLSDEELFYLSQPNAENQVVKITSSKTSTRVKRTTTTTKLAFESVPPEDMLFSEGRGYESLQDQRFVAQRKLYTCATLSEMGISDQVISELPDADDIYWQAIEAREGIYGNDDGYAAQNSQRLKAVYCCYIQLSMNDNNTAELRYIWYSGGHVLKNEPAEWTPYITGSAVPMPHRVQGTGMFELLASVQEGKTHILRNYMDNLDVMNSSRMGVVEGQVNMEDATNGRVNGLIRMRSPDSIVPIPSNDIGGQAIQGLDYLDTVTVQRIGASMDMNEAQAQIMTSSATAAAGTLGEIEKMGGWYATNIVETLLKPSFMMVHRLLRTELGGPMMMKSRDAWVEQDTSQWQERDVVDVTMGMTTGEKTQSVRALQEVVAMQTNIAAQGGSGMLVDKSKLYNALTDLGRANDMNDPSQYWVNPDSEQAQQQEMQAAQQQEQQAQAMQQREDELAQREIDFELEKQRRDLEYKRWSDQLDAEVDEAKITASTVVDMAKVNKPEVKDAAAS